jgi:hypothetical protein
MITQHADVSKSLAKRMQYEKKQVVIPNAHMIAPEPTAIKHTAPGGLF